MIVDKAQRCARLGAAFFVVGLAACSNDALPAATANGAQSPAGTGLGPSAGTVAAAAGSGAGSGPSSLAGSGTAGTGSSVAGRGPASSGGTGAVVPVAGSLASAIAGSGGRVATAAGTGAAGQSAPAAGSGAAGQSAPAAGSGAPAADAPVCKGMTSQVVVVGDSFINWPSHNLPSDLAALAGETWRMYAEGGASMTAGGIATLIPDQFERAITDNKDIKLVVMDGGGNDVLISDTGKYPNSGACKEMGSSKLAVCKQITSDTIATFMKLQDRALAIGVRDIVFFFYPDVPSGTLIGGAYPNEVATYARPMWQASCDGAEQRLGGKLRCHFVDMQPVFKDHPDWFASADIHPNPQGSAAMAKAIWGKMVSDCVWQPASAACGCTP